MICGIITLLFGVLSIIMFSQPIITMYGSGAEGGVETVDIGGSCFDFINFGEHQSVYQTTASVFLILSLVFGGIMLLLTLVNLIARAANNKAFIGAKVAALFFFLCMLVTVIMVGVHCIKDIPGWEILKDAGIYITAGWGLLVAFGSSLICMLFAPRKKK